MENCANILQEYKKLKNNLELLQNSDESNVDEIMSNILNILKFLRNSCAMGSEIQKYISSLSTFFTIMLPLLRNELQLKYSDSNFCDDSLCRMSWQLMANLCVQNDEVQAIVWQNVHQIILDELASGISTVTNIQLMIIYNMLFSGKLKLIEAKIFKLILHIWNKIFNEKPDELNNLDYLHILMEHFVVKYPRIVSLYGPLDTYERIAFLKYLSFYIKNGSVNGPIDKHLLNYISKEFKKKSDCVLRVAENHDAANTINPTEVFNLLDVISMVSGNEHYQDTFRCDHSLFLNIGGLLQQIITIGKQSKNIFTPMQKLDEVALHSKTQSIDFEHEISFEFKTMLIRSLANLLHKNQINQQYARETGIIMAICDCTTLDARNPLIKEWSILAIRNLCENCPENQETISNLCKIGNAPNDVLKELNVEFGSLRIRMNE